jgi:hypothetical protein
MLLRVLSQTTLLLFALLVGEGDSDGGPRRGVSGGGVGDFVSDDDDRGDERFSVSVVVTGPFIKKFPCNHIRPHQGGSKAAVEEAQEV